MANFVRLLVGFALIPACWCFLRTFYDALLFAGGSSSTWSVEGLSLLGGIGAFALCWTTISHPIRTYVFGHEMTHAIWGLLFFARPSDIHVSVEGGSVTLTKSNMLITLAPYFFPFYTFVVIIAALITYAFLRPLPCLPLWLFLIGFTWAFHILFTLQTLTERQPDIKLYGRIFSWTFILIANIAIVLVFLACLTPLTFKTLGVTLLEHLLSTYLYLAKLIWSGTCTLTSWAYHFCTHTGS